MEDSEQEIVSSDSSEEELTLPHPTKRARTAKIPAKLSDYDTSQSSVKEQNGVLALQHYASIPNYVCVWNREAFYSVCV